MYEVNKDDFSEILKENLLRLYLNYYRSPWFDDTKFDSGEGLRDKECESQSSD